MFCRVGDDGWVIRNTMSRSPCRSFIKPRVRSLSLGEACPLDILSGDLWPRGGDDLPAYTDDLSLDLDLENALCFEGSVGLGGGDLDLLLEREYCLLVLDGDREYLSLDLVLDLDLDRDL